MIFWNIGNKFFLLFPVGIFFKRGEYNSDFSKEMSRSVEKYLEQFGL